MGRSRGGTGDWTPPGKSQVVVSFLRNTGTNPLEKQLTLVMLNIFYVLHSSPMQFSIYQKNVFSSSLKKVWILIRCHVPKPADLALQCFYKRIYWVQQDKGKG